MTTPRRAPAVPACLLIVVAAAAASGCAAGESQTVTRTVELDGATAATVHLDMGAGELVVNGGASGLMDGTFQFNVPAWEPVVDFQNGANATLTVRQPGGTGPRFGRTENRWDLRLNNTVPIDLTANMGAAEAELTVGSLDLRSVSVEQGVGELTLDLRGAPRQSYTAHVKGGVGTAHIRVPDSIGVAVSVSSGIGSVDVSGLEKRGDRWVNAGHENDPVALTLEVQSGVGTVEISAEPAP